MNEFDLNRQNFDIKYDHYDHLLMIHNCDLVY